ncbi:hypothetical protein AX14_004096 [Amanita brunnescens Koide BX004]|nr:hypothetical protein AX14_004096 [Amanita brunnescens Koide BX004]
MAGGDAPSFPDLRLETLRISITNGYDKRNQSCPPDQLVALIGKTVLTIKSLGFYCWDSEFNISDFLSSLGSMRLPHLEKFGLGCLAPGSRMPGASNLNKFLLAHNSTLTELSLSHGLLAVHYKEFYEWYRGCFRSVPLNQTLRKLQLTVLHPVYAMTPPYLSILGSIYSSLESLSLLTSSLSLLSLYDVEMLLQSFTCDQLKSLKLHVQRLDTKLLELLKERCPKLQELVLKVNDYREPMSRRTLFDDALREWKGNGEYEDWILSQSLDIHHAEAFKCARRCLGHDMEMLTSSDKELFGDLCETCIHEDSDCLCTLR